MGRRRQSGSVRHLPSGRWQASYWWDGNRHAAPRTFGLRGDATRWLSGIEADLARGGWVDPRAGQITLDRYSRKWLEGRTDLRPRTRELHAPLLRLHIVPALGSVEIAETTPSLIRSWNAQVSGPDGPGRSTAARAYRLVRTILNTAVTDELLVKNPCQVKGAGAERSPERHVAPLATADGTSR